MQDFETEDIYLHDPYLSQNERDNGGRFKNEQGTISWNAEEAWNKHIPYTPGEALNLLTRNIPPCDIRILIPCDNQKPRLQLSIRGLNSEIADNRSMDMSTGRVLQGKIVVSKQQQALGRTLMRNEIEFFHAIGASGMDILAGMATGSYTWARFGFLPNLGNENYFLKNYLPSRFQAIAPFLTRTEKKTVGHAIRLRDGTDLWQVADCQTPVQEAILEIAYPTKHTSASLKLKKLFSAVSQSIAAGTSAPYLNRNFSQEVLKQHEITTLGQFLLLKGDWRGTLDFDNPQQMNRVSNYVGGFQSIDIK